MNFINKILSITLIICLIKVIMSTESDNEKQFSSFNMINTDNGKAGSFIYQVKNLVNN